MCRIVADDKHIPPIIDAGCKRNIPIQEIQRRRQTDTGDIDTDTIRVILKYLLKSTTVYRICKLQCTSRILCTHIRTGKQRLICIRIRCLLDLICDCIIAVRCQTAIDRISVAVHNKSCLVIDHPRDCASGSFVLADVARIVKHIIRTVTCLRLHLHILVSLCSSVFCLPVACSIRQIEIRWEYNI